MMAVHNSLFEDELRRLIDEAIAHNAEPIIAGLMSFEDYRRRVGIIEGLRAALDLCDEANSNLAKR